MIKSSLIKMGDWHMMIAVFSMIENEQERRKLEDFYEENKHFLLHYAKKITKNQEMAEEAIQNAFVSIIERKEKYLELDCRDLLRSTVIIVKRKCIDIFRNNKQYSEKLVNKLKEETKDIDDMYEPATDEKIIFISEYELIRKHMNQIDEVSRLVLEMKYIEEKTYKEIGEELGMTEKHVDTKIMRAKEKVRKLVEKELNYNE
jgi:RNA polymerase sigma-70 factor (ECF subfamily)